jgi:hypothetical protein
MNRLKNYLQCRALAMAYLETAESRNGKGDYGVAIAAIIKAMRYQITGTNNLQSLAFHQKPKARKP